NVSLGANSRGTPIRVRDVAQVRLGPDIRRGVAELDGKGEAVGGIIVMRFGENELKVIDGVKAKLREVQHSMPPGVKIVHTYDPPDRPAGEPPSTIIEARTLPDSDQPRVIIRAAKQVARAIFFSLTIIVVSFVPVFLLEAQEGRMFRPLAFTKTFAMVGASILSITLVPVLMTMFIRGRKLKPESRNPISRFFGAIYDPIIRLALRWKWAALLVNF